MLQIKRTLAIWAIIYPLVTLMLMAMEALRFQAHLAVKTMLMTAVLVPTMVYVIVPAVSRSFNTSNQG